MFFFFSPFSSFLVRVLRGVILSLDRKFVRKEGSAELLRWLYSGFHSSRSYDQISSVRITEAEFREMKEKAAEGTSRLLTTANQGGSHSCVSEAYSFDLLNVLLGNRIELDKTETEIEYANSQSKITDYSFRTLAGDKFGVSVTRACGKDFSKADALQLLSRKLFGVNESTRNVVDEDLWQKQLLHTWCETEEIAAMLKDCYDNDISAAMKQDTFVLLTVVAEGDLIDEIFYASKESANVMRLGGLTASHLRGVFAKELAKRPSYNAEPEVSLEALACRTHAFTGDLLGGLRCQVCNFETVGRVWKCTKGCDIALCGACMDKWKKKINQY